MTTTPPAFAPSSSSTLRGLRPPCGSLALWSSSSASSTPQKIDAASPKSIVPRSSMSAFSVPPSTQRLPIHPASSSKWNAATGGVRAGSMTASERSARSKLAGPASARSAQASKTFTAARFPLSISVARNTSPSSSRPTDSCNSKRADGCIAAVYWGCRWGRERGRGYHVHEVQCNVTQGVFATSSVSWPARVNGRRVGQRLGRPGPHRLRHT